MEEFTGSSKEVVLDEYKYTHTFESLRTLDKNDAYEVSGPIFGRRSNHIQWSLSLQLVESDDDYLEYRYCLLIRGRNVTNSESTHAVISAHASVGRGSCYPIHEKKVVHVTNTGTTCPLNLKIETHKVPLKLVVSIKFALFERSFTIRDLDLSGKVSLGVLQKSFKSLLDSGNMADVTLVTPNGRIAAHKVVLAARSPVFNAMFSTNMLETSNNEVHITDFDKKIVSAMLEYVYTGSTDEVTKSPQDMHYIADKYDLKELREACVPIVMAKVTTENAIENLLMADRLDKRDFKKIVLRFFKSHHSEIAKHADFGEFVKTNPDLYLEVFKEDQL